MTARARVTAAGAKAARRRASRARQRASRTTLRSKWPSRGPAGLSGALGLAADCASVAPSAHDRSPPLKKAALRQTFEALERVVQEGQVLAPWRHKRVSRRRSLLQRAPGRCACLHRVLVLKLLVLVGLRELIKLLQRNACPVTPMRGRSSVLPASTARSPGVVYALHTGRSAPSGSVPCPNRTP